MQKEKRILTLSTLGQFLLTAEGQSLVEEWVFRAANENRWFDERNVRFAVQSIIAEFLNEEKIRLWAKDLNTATSPKNIGIVAAGNIPAVGFYDVLCTYISGHKAHVKLSATDQVLMRGLAAQMVRLDPEAEIAFVERLNHADAFIATGSGNTSRYFEHYFAHKPHIIRKNRSSVAVLNGHESPEDLKNLGLDFFTYYGLGCRNVSKIWVPKGWQAATLLDQWADFDYVFDNHKYLNNYDYNKALLLVNGVPHFDNGFVLLKADETLVSPISVLFVQEYSSQQQIAEWLGQNAEQIQCVIGQDYLPFGSSQRPGLSDGPDGVNVLEFLKNL